MSCEEMVGLLLDFIGEELAPEQRAALEEHLCGCRPCAVQVELYRATIVVTRALPKCEHERKLPAAFEAKLRAMLGVAEK